MKLTLPFVLLFLSASSKAQNEKLEREIMDSVFKLKEVKQRVAYVERHSNGKRHLSGTFYSKPTAKEPYYWVMVQEYNGYTYHTHFHFFVYPKPFEIKYYDTARDTAISLNEWRYELKHHISN